MSPTISNFGTLLDSKFCNILIVYLFFQKGFNSPPFLGGDLGASKQQKEEINE